MLKSKDHEIEVLAMQIKTEQEATQKWKLQAQMVGRGSKSIIAQLQSDLEINTDIALEMREQAEKIKELESELDLERACSLKQELNNSIEIQTTQPQTLQIIHPKFEVANTAVNNDSDVTQLEAVVRDLNLQLDSREVQYRYIRLTQNARGRI